MLKILLSLMKDAVLIAAPLLAALTLTPFLLALMSKSNPSPAEHHCACRAKLTIILLQQGWHGEPISQSGGRASLYRPMRGQETCASCASGVEFVGSILAI